MSTSLPTKRQLEVLDDKRSTKKQHYDSATYQAAPFSWKLIPHKLLTYWLFFNGFLFILAFTATLALNIVLLALAFSPFIAVTTLVNRFS